MPDLSQMKDWHIAALLRVAKTRAWAFFGHPRAMITLRLEAERRGITL